MSIDTEKAGNRNQEIKDVKPLKTQLQENPIEEIIPQGEPDNVLTMSPIIDLSGNNIYALIDATEKEVAEALIKKMNNDFMIVVSFDQESGNNKNFWALWTGKTWKVDFEEAVRSILIPKISTEFTKLKNIVRENTKDNFNYEPDSENETEQEQKAREKRNKKKEAEEKKIQKLIKDIESVKYTRTMFEALKMFESVLIDYERFDQNPHLLNTLNATIELRGAEGYNAREHRKEDYLTTSLDCSYNPAAKCPKWEEFLETIFLENKELIKYVQKVLGNTLSGKPEQFYHICYGSGANGKGVFVKVLSHIFGAYHVEKPFSTFKPKKFDDAKSTDLEHFKSARFVTVSELDETPVFDEPLVKRLTGGDKIQAYKNYVGHFHFYAKFTLWFFGNNKPSIKGSDTGIRRRTRLIPFSYTFPENKRKVQEKVVEELLSEKEGILNWLLEGYVLWANETLAIAPEIVISESEELVNENDVLEPFLELYFDRGEVSNKSFKTLLKGFRIAFFKYAANEHLKYDLKPDILKNQLRNKMLIVKKDPHGNQQTIFGIKLKKEMEDEYYKLADAGMYSNNEDKQKKSENHSEEQIRF